MTDDVSSWLRVHALSLDKIEGTTERELLLEFQGARVITTDTPPGHQGLVQSERFVLGPDAASILLRLLLDAGVAPKDGKKSEVLSH